VYGRTTPYEILMAALFAMTAACTNGAARSRGPADEADVQPRALPNVTAARELDQGGVRMFREARYADAIRYFRAAYRLGGPSSELWNVARSRERLDDPEGACVAIDEYLAQHDLSPQDRAEAEREARALKSRTSVLTVTTTPTGAFVTIDGAQVAGPTPVSVEVPPGAHTIVVRRDGNASETRTLQARFGRAIIVSLDLASARK
jgi:outer membrane receptor for ferrienterochelin and colicins